MTDREHSGLTNPSLDLQRSSRPPAITQAERYWLAGLMEGEGYFGLRSDTGTPQVKLEMTDEDIVLRVLILMQRITGKQYNIAHVSRKDKRSASSDTFVLALYGKDAIKVMKTLVDLMGFRRRKKIWQSLNGHKEKKIDEPNIDMKEFLQKLKPRNVVPMRIARRV